MYPMDVTNGIPDDYKTIIERNGKYFLVSTVLTFDYGCFETMVFSCDKNGKPLSFADLLCTRYHPKQNPLVGHKAVVKDFYLH